MKRSIAFAVLVAVTMSVVAQSAPTKSRPVLVSLIRLIAVPEKFSNERVRVQGFLDYGGGLDDSVCLFVTESDARNGIDSNCVPLDISVTRDDKRLRNYVVLNATFRYRPAEDYGHLEHISDMQMWPR